jgi:hypothetical protein
MTLPVMNILGVDRKLAALSPSPQHARIGRVFKEVHEVVDPASWTDTDLSQTYKTPIRDQGQHGSCTGHAGVTALTYALEQAGVEPPLLSCTFPYGLVNGGQDNGASVSSILQVLLQTGTCTEAVVPEALIYQNQFPQNAWTDAQNWMAAEFLKIATYEELCQAISLGYPTAFGIRVGRNFSNLNAQGVCPLPNMVIGGHALCGVGLKKTFNDSWLVKFQNSWTANWGLSGFAYLTRGHFDQLIDAYAITHPKILTPDGPPIAKTIVQIVEKVSSMICREAEPPVPPQPVEPVEGPVAAVPEVEEKDVNGNASWLHEFDKPTVTEDETSDLLPSKPRKRRPR